MPIINGSKLNATARRDALARFVYRFTMDHVPKWAHEMRVTGDYYAPQFANDDEWLAHTEFHVTRAGNISRARKWYQTTGQTWPMGKSLAQPYRIAQ